MPGASSRTYKVIRRCAAPVLLLVCLLLSGAVPGNGGIAVAQESVASPTGQPDAVVPWWGYMGSGGVLSGILWGVWRMIASGKGSLILRLGGKSAEQVSPETPAKKPPPPPPPAGSAVRPASNPVCSADPAAFQEGMRIILDQITQIRENQGEQRGSMETLRADVSNIKTHLQDERNAEERRIAAEEAVASATERVADALEKRSTP